MICKNIFIKAVQSFWQGKINHPGKYTKSLFIFLFLTIVLLEDRNYRYQGRPKQIKK